MNNIPTAHVILGINDTTNAGEDAFMAFDRGRRGLGDQSVSDWYKDSANKQHVILSTLDESDIVKFSTSFNLTETQDQSLFIFEVMDPNGTFEKNYFKHFYDGISKYSTFVDGYLGKAKSGLIDWIKGEADLSIPGGPLRDINSLRRRLTSAARTGRVGEVPEFRTPLGTDIHGEPIGPTAAGKVLGDLSNEIWESPYRQSMFVTFGIGDVPSDWAPVQKCQLVSLHYSLTPEGIRKYTLKFVATAGLLAFGENEETEQYLTSTGRTENRVTLPYMYLTSRTRVAGGSVGITGTWPEWRVNNPVKMVLGMVKGMFNTIMKDPPFLVLEDLERVLEARWTQTAINYFKQQTDILRGNSLLPDQVQGNNLFDTDQFAMKLARSMNFDVDSAPLRHFSGDPTATPLLGLDTPGAIAKKEALEELGYIWEPLGGEITVEQLESLNREYRKSQLRRGHSGGVVTEADAATSRTWFNSQQQAHGAFYKGWEVPGSGGLHILPPKIIRGGAALLVSDRPAAWTDLTPGPTRAPYITAWLDKIMKEEDLATFKEHISPDTTYAEIQQAAAADINNEYVNLNVIHLSRKETYTIYLALGIAFFERLGMSISYPHRVTTNIMGAPDIYGTAMSPTTFKDDNADLKPVSVHWKKDGVKETSNALQKLIKELNIEEKDELMILGFSELSLIDRFRKNSDVLSILSKDLWTDTVPQDRFVDLDTVILVSSVRIISSLVNATPIKALYRRNDQYRLLTRLFEGFKKDEPITPRPLDKDGWSFSPLASNPDVGSTQLPSQYPGEPNYLSVFGNIQSLHAATGKEGPFTEEEFRSILSEYRIPVFNYGLKNSNVRSCDFDLAPWYGYFLDIIPTTILTGLISASLKNEPAVQKIQQFYNDLSGNPAQSVDLAIDTFWKENIEESIDELKYTGFIDPKTKKVNPAFPKALHKVSGDIASVLSAQTLAQLSLAGAEALPDFTEVVKDYLRVTLGAPSIASKLVLNPEMQSEALEKILLMRQKLGSRTFSGTLNTLPIFSIMSPAKTISSRALLYFVEPEFTLSPVENNSQYRSTWLSGEYYIVGYEVEITKDDIISRFNVIKNPEKAQGVGA